MTQPPTETEHLASFPQDETSNGEPSGVALGIALAVYFALAISGYVIGSGGRSSESAMVAGTMIGVPFIGAMIGAVIGKRSVKKMIKLSIAWLFFTVAGLILFFQVIFPEL